GPPHLTRCVGSSVPSLSPPLQPKGSLFPYTTLFRSQMRGRAIRVDPNVPDKTGAIWHLACIDEKQPFGGHDVRSLHRRFKSLVRSEEHTSELQSRFDIVCPLLLGTIRRQIQS